MAKLYGPLFSLDARGKLGKALVYSIWKGLNYVRKYVIPANPNTAAQLKVEWLRWLRMTPVSPKGGAGVFLFKVGLSPVPLRLNYE